MIAKFNVCLICKLPGFREHHLCRHCALELRSLQSPVVRQVEGLVARSLFSWREGGARGLADLVYALKGRDDAHSWFELAVWMVDRFERAPTGPAVFVPVPGAEPNHALGLARALARVVGADVMSALLPVKKRSQKALTKSERRTIEFGSRGARLCSDYNTVLIVDDVITTGATAEAAFRALDRPENCEVWCLLDRRPCGAPNALL